jgi:hypothetical protein
MACPLFLPAESLGDYYTGECAAAAGEPIGSATLRHCCNVGYARKACVRAAETEADAIQFVLRADRGGPGTSDREIELGWAMERNHHPLAVGTILLPLLPETPVTPLEVQARAFGAAYLNQKF